MGNSDRQDPIIRSHEVFPVLRSAITSIRTLAAYGILMLCAGAVRAEKVPHHLVVSCATLLKFQGDASSDPTVRVTEAVLRGESALKLGPPMSPPMEIVLPAHCEVMGQLQERTGIDGQTYAIRFHLRLPVEWNGRFLFQGGGGSNGFVGTATGNLGSPSSPSALARGFAVVSQDSGHSNDLNVDPSKQGPVSFGHDFQARRDYAYSSQEVVTRVAKSLIRTAYGKAPTYSYYDGCSKGGQEGMMMAQRFPTYFDGILAGAPGFTLPKASAIGESWDSQALAGAATSLGEFDKAGVPLLNKAFTDEDLALVSAAVNTACDALDGLKDGMVQSFSKCTTAMVSPALQGITCTGAKSNECISTAQVDALKRIFEGARNKNGELLYATWPWDSGIGGKGSDGKYYQGWRMWKMGPYASDTNDAINVTLGAAAASAIFITPPAEVPMDGNALTKWALSFDVDSAGWRIFQSTIVYPESAWDTMSADSLDRTQFSRHGGKLLLYHGVSDPIFSINDTIRWLLALDRVEHGRAGNYARLFAVPGMPHCLGGPSTNEFDFLGPLMDWVERGKAPESIIARAPADAPWPGRTRPLCVFPKEAHYLGKGSIEEASNFSCQ